MIINNNRVPVSCCLHTHFRAFKADAFDSRPAPVKSISEKHKRARGRRFVGPQSGFCEHKDYIFVCTVVERRRKTTSSCSFQKLFPSAVIRRVFDTTIDYDDKHHACRSLGRRRRGVSSTSKTLLSASFSPPRELESRVGTTFSPRESYADVPRARVYYKRTSCNQKFRDVVGRARNRFSQNVSRVRSAGTRRNPPSNDSHGLQCCCVRDVYTRRAVWCETHSTGVFTHPVARERRPKYPIEQPINFCRCPAFGGLLKISLETHSRPPRGRSARAFFRETRNHPPKTTACTLETLHSDFSQTQRPAVFGPSSRAHDVRLRCSTLYSLAAFSVGIDWIRFFFF